MRKDINFNTLEIQRDLAFELASSDNLNEALNIVLDKIFQLGEVDSGGVYIVDDDKNLELIIHKNLSEIFVNEVKFLKSDSKNAKLIHEGEPIYLKITDLINKNADVSLDIKEGLKFLASVPIKYNQNVIAVLNLASHKFDDISMAAKYFIELVSAQIGGAILRIKYQNQTKQSEQIFNIVVENSSQFIYDYNIETGEIICRGAVESVTGYTKEEFNKFKFEEWTNRIHIDDVTEASLYLEKSLKYRLNYDHIYRFKIKDGSFRYFHDYGLIIDNDKDHLHMLGIIKDITNMKLIENELNNNVKKFKDISFSMGDVIWETDEYGRYTFVSEKVKKIYGYSPKEILMNTRFDFMEESESKRTKAIYENILNSKSIIKDLKNFMIRKDGKKVCLLTNGVPIIDDYNNIIGYRGVDKDITETELAREKLIFNEQLLRTMIENSGLGMLVIGNIKNDILYINNNLINIFGTYLSASNKLFKFDFNQFVELFNSNVSEPKNISDILFGIINKNDKLIFEVEVKFNNNRVVRCVLSHIKNENDINYARFYLFEDITEYKLLESLKRSEKDYNLFVNNLPDGITIFDYDLNIKSVNNATCLLSGFSENELLNMKITDILDTEDLIKKPIQFESFLPNRTLINDRILVKKTGEKIYVEIRAKILLGKRILAIIRDLIPNKLNGNKYDNIDKINLLENLFIRLKTFSHGESSSMILSRISFYTKNIEVIWKYSPSKLLKLKKDGKIIAKPNFERLNILANEFINYTYQEILHIYSLLKIIESDINEYDAGIKINDNLNNLLNSADYLKNIFDKYLMLIENKIKIIDSYRDGKDIASKIRNIKKEIKFITNIFLKTYIVNISKENKFILNRFNVILKDVKLFMIDLNDSQSVFFNSNDYREVISVLIQNSIESLSISNNDSKFIKITVLNNKSSVIIEIEDNGLGVISHNQTKIFDEGFTTKGEEHGFGLTFVKKTLIKYGGDITYDSGHKEGAKFILTFKSF